MSEALFASTGLRRGSPRRVLYVQYTNPAAYPPLQHISHILAQDGWEGLFLGTGAFGADTLTFAPHEQIRVLQMRFSSSGWRQKLHYVRFAIWVMWWRLRWRPQWVYASDSLSCPVALALSYTPGLRVVYHEHDSPSFAAGTFFQRICLAARRKLAHRAKLNVLPNEQRAELFASEMGDIKNVVCVWNCPSLDEVGLQRNGHEANDLWVLYHGSIVPTRLPLTVFQALALLPASVKLRVIGYETIGHQGYVERLKMAAREYGIAERIQFLGTIPGRDELLCWCSRSDVGLAFMPKASDDFNEQNMVGASNKPFDYLSCGLALLVSDLPDWRAMFVDSGCGLACDVDEPESIAAALGWFLAHPVEMRRMGEQGRQRIAAEWNYEQQFMPVFQRLNLHGSEL